MIDLNQSPYFDDYKPDNGFYKILFRPGYPVQARELTQIQTIIQNQIDNFGSHVFKDGSKVLGGDVTYNKVNYIRVTLPDGATLESITNQTIESGSGAKAKTLDADTSTVHGTYDVEGIIAINYITGNEFSVGDVLTIPGYLTNVVVTEVGQASLASIQEGFFYVGGYFVQAPQQSIFLSLDHNASVSVGLSVSEHIVTESTDTTLLDPAYGSSNFNAPGAHRYSINLLLSYRPYVNTNSSEPSYVEIMKILDGELVSAVKNPKYNVLEDELARRTYDESGSYTVRPFELRVEDNNEGDDTKLDVILEAGKAYVNGYEFETISKTVIPVEKARDVEFYNNSDAFITYGLYYIVNSITGRIFDFANFEMVDLKNGSNTTIGSARVKVVYPDGEKYRVYLTDIQNSGGGSDDVRKIVGRSTNAVATVDVSGGTNELLRGIKTSLLSEMSPNNPEPGSITDVNYTTQRTFNNILDSGFQITINTSSAQERFSGNGTFAGTDSFIKSNYIFIVNGAIATPTSVEIPLVGAAEVGRLTATFSSGGSISILTTIEVNESIHKTKIRRHAVMNNVSVNANWKNLNHHDVIVKSLVIKRSNNGEDVTHLFQKDDGQRDEYYDRGRVRSTTGSMTVNIEYDYFEHTGVGYFTVDSYQLEPYGDIPTYTSGSKVYDLKSCFDFRPSIVVPTAIQLPKNNTSVSFDFNYYLPRADLVVATRSRELKVIRGVPSIRPKLPLQPDGTMALYGILLNPYTNTVNDVEVKFFENKRYTMRDIGKLERRIYNLEYYTALSLLETKTSSSTISGKFRNGFIVDSFTKLDIVDFNHPETSCFINLAEEVCTPNFIADEIQIDKTTIPSGVKLTDDGIIVREYTDKSVISQDVITGFINVNPFAVFSWTGTVTLDPAVDTWFDTERLPDIVRTVGTDQGTTVNQIVNTWVSGRLNMRTTTTTTTTSELESEAVSDVEVGQTVIPFIRQNDVRVKVEGLLPNRRHYFQFDGVDVNQHVADWGSTNFGAIMETDSKGTLDALFRIPEGVFRTGERLLSVSDRVDHDDILQQSHALGTYTAQGTLILRQRTVTNRWVQKTSESQTSEIISVRRWIDPLAETFLVDETIYPDGIFVSSVDVFFISKDNNIPVTLELRPTVNGYPDSVRVYPFATSILDPSEVVVNDRNNLIGFTGDEPNKFKPTRFHFDTPIHLEPGEHCFVIMSNSNEYNVGYATIGKNIHRSDKVVTENPYGGVMFMSQNASTWTADQYSDLAFTINRCSFTEGRSDNIVWEVDDNTQADFDTIAFDAQLNTFDTTSQDFILTSRPKASVTTDNRAITPTAGTTFNERREVTGSNDLFVTGSLTSTEVLSPMIDNQSVKFIRIENIVNNDSTDEEIPYGGNALARYIHQRVDLEEDYVADELRIWFDATIPSGASLKVYLKSQNSGQDSSPFNDLGWRELTTYSREGTEYQYSEQVPEGMTSYQVKVVFLADNEARVPSFGNFRVVSFQS